MNEAGADIEVSAPKNSESGVSQNDSKDVLLQSMQASQGVSFIKTCLDTKTATISSSPNGEITVDQEKLSELIKSISKHIQDFYEAPGLEYEPISIPDNFNYEKIGKTAVRDAVDIIYKNNIIPIDILIKASKYVGPGNVHIAESIESNDSINLVPAAGSVEFSSEYVNERYHSGRPLPIPLNKSERNILLSLNLSKSIFEEEAMVALAGAKKCGLQLTQEQAINYVVFDIASHEYAHAINFAIDYIGADSFTRARESSTVPFDIFPSDKRQVIHRELFARGLQDQATNLYLRDKFGWSDDKIKEFKAQYDSPAKGKAAESLFKYAKEAGINPDELYAINLQLRKTAVDLHGAHIAPFVPDLAMMLEYMREPYTPEEIAYLIDSAHRETK